MAFRSRFSPAAAIVAALTLRVALSPAPLVAQQDSGMMAHDSAVSRPGESGMTTSHDSGMMGNGNTMQHEEMGARAGARAFMGNNGEQATGSYQVTDLSGKRQLTLSDDFSVEGASDLYLVLTNGLATDAGTLYLGKLKKASGTQSFELPKGKDLTGYKTLLVWSKVTRKSVATAEWHPSSGKMMDHM